MTEFIPVRTVADLFTLDDVEMLDGYNDGFRGEPAPGDNRSRSYHHGWRNGAVDAHRRQPDDAQAELAHDYLRRARAN